MDNDITNASAEQTPFDEATDFAGDAFLQAFEGDENAVSVSEAPESTDVTEFTADPPANDEQPEQPEDDGKDYTIKYKGKEETLHLNGEQLIRELQKARDYDSVRSERDELKSGASNGQAALSVVEYFAQQNGMTTDEYIAYCNTQMSDQGEAERLTEEYGELPEAAMQEILAARREAAAKKAEAAKDAALQADIDALKAEYPDADIANLPEDVAAAIEGGMKPVEAYRLHELRELRASQAALNTEIAALKKEKDNHFRSPGRAESKSSVAADLFLKGFTGGG